MTDAISADTLAAHTGWLELHDRTLAAREKWSLAEWVDVRSLAEYYWEADPSGLYLYKAERALRAQQYGRAKYELKRRAGFDQGWLLEAMSL